LNKLFNRGRQLPQTEIIFFHSENSSQIGGPLLAKPNSYTYTEIAIVSPFRASNDSKPDLF
jgi:hypothetical protein